MNRKSLIYCLSALAVFAAMIMTAVFFLYRKDDTVVYAGEKSLLIDAVPSNAVVVCILNQAGNIEHPLLSFFDVPGALAELFEGGQLGTFAKAPMVFSLHYAGKLAPLYVFDAGPASAEPSQEAEELITFFLDNGFQASFVDCSTLARRGGLSGRSVVIAAETSSMITSSVNNIRQSLTITDVDGFQEAMDMASGKDALFVSYNQAKPLFTSIFIREHFKSRYGQKQQSKKYSEAADFFVSLADWAVLDLTDAESTELNLSFRQLLDDDGSDFLSVLDKTSPSVSSVSSVLPSYTAFALSIPMADRSEYLAGYKVYLDSKQLTAAYEHRQSDLKKRENISPSAFIDLLGVKEVATACFGTSSVLRVNLAKISNPDTLLLRGTGHKAFPSSPELMEYRFQSYLSSVFGEYFALQDESYFTYMNGWLISGSRQAVEEYVSGRALEYDLKQYMSDAGHSDFMAERICAMTAYINAAGNDALLSKVISKEVRSLYKELVEGAEYAPAILSVYRKNDELHSDVDIYHLEMRRSRASEFERDTTVVVPSGPFRVINSGTGRTNLFYQQSNGAVGLKEEDGTGIWAVPFKDRLCGTAQNVDYYANGKKQILFGAGSSIYLIDRLGRYVNGFPVDLGNEILIGPDVYDFNGTNAYNIMVLHKDNTIQMYNLKGRKPESWLGIAPKHTIRQLPERIIVDGNTFWVVRTSIQTLIYPFVGGTPLTQFEGDRQILPTSEVIVRDASTVEFKCYDGITRTLRLK